MTTVTGRNFLIRGKDGENLLKQYTVVQPVRVLMTRYPAWATSSPAALGVVRLETVYHRA